MIMENMIVPVTDKIFWVGANDYDTHLFEAIWPLPEGVSYNSYLIRDEKVVLMDAVKSTTEHILLDKLNQLLDGRKIDYLVINHMEPDHSGAISMLKQMYPDMEIIGNKKTLTFLKDFYNITDKVKEIKDGDELDIGEHTLQFHITPMVHWPETMVTYEKSRGVLFSADVFGGFGALKGGIFDDEVDLDFYENEIRRYFSNIVGKYCKMTQKALAKLSGLDIKIVAPTHGPVFRKNPQYIIDKYDKWSRHETEKGVVIAFASMYGNTQKMAEAIARSLAEKGIRRIRMHNVSYTHPSYIINDIWQFKGFILGSCTYNTRIFPHMEMLINMLENKKLYNRYLGYFGSFTWSGGAFKGIKEFVQNSGLDVIEPGIEVKCHPTQDDLNKCMELGKNMAAALA